MADQYGIIIGVTNWHSQRRGQIQIKPHSITQQAWKDVASVLPILKDEAEKIVNREASRGNQINYVHLGLIGDGGKYKLLDVLEMNREV